VTVPEDQDLKPESEHRSKDEGLAEQERRSNRIRLLQIVVESVRVVVDLCLRK
jgi:hypothetical protein